LGIIFIGIGIVVRLGLWKGWYWRSRGGVYGYIPMGIVFILYSYISEIREIGGTIYYGYTAIFLIFIGLTLYFSLRPPNWIKPRWVKWIERYPKHVVDKMRESASEKDADWKSYVTDEESVDKWAKKFRSR
jgi:hypothetical protein